MLLDIDAAQERCSDNDSNYNSDSSVSATSPADCEKHFSQQPRYVDLQDITLEKCVGTGSFSTVFRARFHSKNSKNLLNRSSLNNICSSGSSSDSTVTEITDTECTDFNYEGSPQHAGPEYYALKRLSKRTLSCAESIEVAKKDLEHEAEMLLKLPPHENIIKLYALSSNFWSDIPHAFLILEQLSETLHCRLCRWRTEKAGQVAAPSWSLSLLGQKYKDRIANEQAQRVAKIGVPVARAMAFLHSKKVIYRDLKPKNIGFHAQTGQVQLFDFGLAREHTGEDGDRRLTGFTGTQRYMAPEVMSYSFYSTPADVYSYAVVLWELCTLRKPYENIRNMKKLVLRKNARPSLSCVVDQSVRNTIEMAWHPEPNLRPSFALITHQLGQQLQ